MCAMCVHTSEPDESEYEFLNDLFYSNLKEVMQPVRTDRHVTFGAPTYELTTGLLP